MGTYTWIIFPDIEYIKGAKNIVADSLSRFTINRNQETAQDSTYKKDIVSEINNTEELSDIFFSMELKHIDHYQRKFPCLKDKYYMGTYHRGSGCGVSNIHLKLIKCEA